MSMTGLEVLSAGLAELGVTHVFGLPGSQNAGLFSSLPEAGVVPVLATDETSAAFMAMGFAKASGGVGVLATIPGPGFAFALPGLAEARLDSVPILHLVGTPSAPTTGFGHQAIDQVALATPLVKAVIEIRDPGDVGARLREAHAHALAGEPGPVLVHLDPAALRGSVEGHEAAQTPPRPQEPSSIEKQIEELRSLIDDARRPVLFLGAGALSSAALVRSFCETLGLPVFTTLSGRGVLPEDHPSSLAFDVERGGLGELNAVLDQSDLVLAFGCKLSHNGTAGFRLRLPAEYLVQVNTDPFALGASYPGRLLIQATVQEVIEPLVRDTTRLGPPRWSASELEELKGRIGRPHAPALPEPRFTGVADGTPEAFFRALRRALPRNAILVTDSGLHQVMTRRYFESLVPNGLITPADFQSMGFGVPAAIGASLAQPTRTVVALVGDGGFLMSAMDLLCAVREESNVTVVVFNDGYLGLIRLQQAREFGRTAGVTLTGPDLELLSSALGVEHHLVEGDPERTLGVAVRSPNPSLVEVRLGDSMGTRRIRAQGVARRAVRRTLGERVVRTIKAVLRRKPSS